MYKAYLHSLDNSGEFICSSPNRRICVLIAQAETEKRTHGVLAIYGDHDLLRTYKVIGKGEEWRYPWPGSTRGKELISTTLQDIKTFSNAE